MTNTLSTARGPVRMEPASRRAHRRRRLPPPATLGLAALGALVAVHIALGVVMRVPIIQPDELGYLQNARFLARGGLRSETEYYPGFSLLLVPLWWISTSPTVVFHGALIVTSLIAAASAWLVWRLTPKLAPGLSGWRRALVTGAVCAYPAAVLYTDFALAEVAFAAMFVVVCVVAARALPGHHPAWWGALGIASGGLALVHPRGFAVMVAAGAFGVVLLGFRRATAPALTALVAGLAIGLGVTRWLVTFTKGHVAPGFGAYRPDSVLSKSLSVHGLSSLVAEAAGQLWYLTVATLGLAPLALLAGGRSLYRVATGDRRPWVLLQGFVTLSFMGVWGLSSLFMNLGDRAEKLVYGRYNEGVVAPLIIIAVADILGTGLLPRRRAHLRWLTVGVITAVVTGLFVQLGHSRTALRGVINPANVLGLAPLIVRMGNHLHPLAMSGVAIVVLAVLAAVAWRFPAVAVVAVTAVFLVSAWDTQRGYIAPGTRARGQQDEIADAIVAASRVGGVNATCVGWDPALVSEYNFFNDRFLLPAQQITMFDGGSGAPPCGTLVVSSRDDLAARYPGARVITGENFVDQRLWAVPRTGDPTFSALDAAGWLAPPSPTGSASVPLPDADLTGATITVAGRETTIPSGRTSTTSVVVRHGPGGAPWPDVAGLHSGSALYAVRVGLRWSWDAAAGPAPSALATAPAASCAVGVKEQAPITCPFADLPVTLLPGEHATIPVELAAVDAGRRPLPPGSYLVQVTLFQSGVNTFRNPPQTIHVRVT